MNIIEVRFKRTEKAEIGTAWLTGMRKNTWLVYDRVNLLFVSNRWPPGIISLSVYSIIQILTITFTNTLCDSKLLFTVLGWII